MVNHKTMIIESNSSLIKSLNGMMKTYIILLHSPVFC